MDVADNGGGREGYENLLYSYLGPNYQKYRGVTAKAQHVRLANGVDEPVTLKTFGPLERWWQNERQPDGSYARKPNRGHGLRVFAKTPEHPYDREVLVLISPVTYSGGSEFANMMRYSTDAVSVGEETGGGYCGNTSGYGREVRLPHSGITVDVPALRFEMNVGEESCGRGVIPDVRAVPTRAEWLAGEDVRVRAAREYGR